MEVKLDLFKPRSYQTPIIDAIENKGYRKLIIVLPRRAGKDIVAFNALIRQALMRVGSYCYLLPNSVQARRVMWEGITNSGFKILNFIPKELIKGSPNISQMKIELCNSSVIYFFGSERFDSLRGLNAIGFVVSEAGYSNPMVYSVIKPIIAQNKGWVMMISTPNGDNHFHDIWKIARKHPDEWFSYIATIDETKHISVEEIESDIDRGEISREFANQEYYVSFARGANGSYYSTYLDKMYDNGQIGRVLWDPSYPVHTVWDLGVADDCVIIWFQIIGLDIRIIDIHVDNGKGLDHYVSLVLKKEYIYGRHLAPHDIRQREQSDGVTRLDKAKGYGIEFTDMKRSNLMLGVEKVRTTLSRVWIDDKACKSLITALRNYRREYDEAKQVYSDKPVHDRFSHQADALRYLCMGIHLVTEELTQARIDEMRKKARYSTPDSSFQGTPFDDSSYGSHQYY